MFCKNCGQELVDGVTFCSGCGTPVSAEVPAESPVIPEPPHKKKSPKWLIPAIAAAAAVVILIAAVSGAFASPSARVGKALTKSGGAFAAILKETGLSEVSELMVQQDYTQEFAFWLEQAEDASELAGLGIRFTTDVSMTDRVMGVDMTPYLGSADLVKLHMKVDNEKIYLGSPELTKDSFFMIDTTTIGSTLARLTGEEQLQSVSFNVFDLATQIQQMQTLSKEAQENLQAAFLEFASAAEVTKTGKTIMSVNGQELKCAAYHAVIPEAALDQLLTALEEAYRSVDTNQAYVEMMKSMGMPEEIIEQMGYALDESSSETDYYFEELHNAVEDLGDVELDLYVNKGYVVAALYKDIIDESEVEFALYVGGGKNYADNISLRAVVDGEALQITSTGNHTCENGQFTDKTEIVIDEDGAGTTVASMELAYTPKAEADNFLWSVTADETTLSAAGQVTFQKDSISVLLDKITFDDTVTVGMEYQLGSYQGDRMPINTHMALDEMTEEELYDALEDLSSNAQEWIMGLMQKFPELMNIMY